MRRWACWCLYACWKNMLFSRNGCVGRRSVVFCIMSSRLTQLDDRVSRTSHEYLLYHPNNMLVRGISRLACNIFSLDPILNVCNLPDFGSFETPPSKVLIHMATLIFRCTVSCNAKFITKCDRFVLIIFHRDIYFVIIFWEFLVSVTLNYLFWHKKFFLCKWK